MHQGKTPPGIRWQVIISLFSWLCHSVSAQIHYSIVEEMRKGSLVGDLVKDLGMSVKDITARNIRIVSDVSEKYFSINLESGHLFITERIDRETLCGAADDCVLTFDAVAENPLNVFNVKIEIQDINDNPPRFLDESIRLEISEYASPGAKFVLQKAEDLDIGINTLKSYRLSSNEHFVLGEKISSDGSIFPELVLEKPLDRETQDYHELLLSSVDGGKPVQTGSLLIKIAVIDINDNTPIFTQELYKISVKENTAWNSTVLKVKATDEDEGVNAQITYSFSTLANDIHQMFTINRKNGDITTKGHLDYEIKKRYEISVQAKDGGGLAANAKVLLEILDENDNVPEISLTSLSSLISEDTSPGTLVALIAVRDKDSGENGEVQCQIIGDIPFQLVSSTNNFYKIVTNDALDREKMPSYNITIQASDKGSPSLSSVKVIYLDLADINDNAPVFEKQTYSAFVPENNLPGASIFHIQAKDIDSEENAKLTYSVVSKDKNPISLYISINPVTGVIYAQKSYDYEQHREFYIQVIAKDNGSPSLNSSTTLKIHVVDQNDNPPVILYPPTDSDGPVFEMVPWSSEQGSLVSKVVAVDADSGHNAWLSYFLQASEPSLFTIDQHTGEIKTSNVFQDGDSLKHRVVVVVKDNGHPALSASVTLTLVIADNFQQIIPEMNKQPSKLDSQSNLQMYLVIALALISFLFLLTVIVAVVSKCRDSKSLPSLGPVNTHLYHTVDPRFLSQFNNGTLQLPYTYNVFPTLDSTDKEFSFLKTQQTVPVVPVDRLIDADDSGIGNENVKDPITDDSLILQQSQPNADWQFTQGQRPGPSGTQQPTEESGVWPNNQFETERLQAMILASANEAAEGNSGLVGSTGTMGLSARYGPQFTLQHVPDYRQNIYIPGTTTTLTNAPGKRDNKAPSGNKKKSGKKEKK
ncbi:PREDICTED: protocadherin gamma-B1-like isoform X6 [Nanorana parkeri]|uniref:protocadherin gamma-B1-like isoform X6 n=1 Tax=Nanorana parkeri TaxID=125878 RepID=UPI0008549BC3|nr:PREDICTED: protocadherin gamma-B1-like isoform X6 [Nanorana parkeri]